MKTLIFLVLAIFIYSGCDDKKPERYTQQSSEIDTYKKVIAAYENQDWEELISHYADTAKIMNNVTEENGLTISQLVDQDKEDASIFRDWDFVDKDSEYEMVLTDKGETWVNFWGLWQATLQANNKQYKIPAHITARFVDGKIVKEFGYWDISEITTDMQTMQDTILVPEPIID